MPIKLTIVADTNIFVSAALAIHSNRLDSPTAELFTRIANGDVIAVASQQTLYELADKLTEPRFGLPGSFILDFVTLVSEFVELVAIRGLDMGCRDERDNMFIETAFNGRVDALITRDPDLQDARTRYDLAKRECQVLNVSEVLTMLRKPESSKEEAADNRS